LAAIWLSSMRRRGSPGRVRIAAERLKKLIRPWMPLMKWSAHGSNSASGVTACDVVGEGVVELVPGAGGARVRWSGSAGIRGWRGRWGGTARRFAKWRFVGSRGTLPRPRPSRCSTHKPPEAQPMIGREQASYSASWNAESNAVPISELSSELVLSFPVNGSCPSFAPRFLYGVNVTQSD
jgi:hypothetical protein